MSYQVLHIIENDDPSVSRKYIVIDDQINGFKHKSKPSSISSPFGSIKDAIDFIHEDMKLCWNHYNTMKFEIEIEESKNDLILRLLDHLDQMDVPKGRETDLHWLERNLFIRNSNNVFFNRASMIIKQLLKRKE